jgi:hypothetical protein
MCRKLVAVVVVVMLAIVGFGCRKKPAQTAPPTPKTPPQTAQQESPKPPPPRPADFNEAAKKEITSENMQTELDKLEKDIQREGGGAM